MDRINEGSHGADPEQEELQGEQTQSDEIKVILPSYDSCGHCKCFEPIENQPRGLPLDAIAGTCRRYPPTVQLRPEQVQGKLIQEGGRPSAPQMVLVPTSYFPPVLSLMPACGEFRMRMGLKKGKKRKLRVA